PTAPAGRGHPTRRTDHPRGRRARLDAHDADLPCRPACERGARRVAQRRRLTVLPTLRECPRARARGRRFAHSGRPPAAGGPRSHGRVGRGLIAAVRSDVLAFSLTRSILVDMPRKSSGTALREIDPAALAEFQAGLRKRYTDEQILDELKACAERLGRSPTMREFAADPKTTLHPQTVIEHFGSWNRAKRLAGLVPRRFATREELLALLKELGEELGRVPTAKDIDANRSLLPSKSLYWHTFGSLTNALREAGFDVPVG